ncbi:type II toxin-antitoxin system VapC family toxin [Lederbergia ruris]|uniref:DNA-binding protein n=1 Tax=Lederbergia ruris TaxID=217495 RepID=A0ABQ4KFR1_9BACI|nr:PIN domain-containing protein [Lederbergia ruris]GIN56805.1 DNA-binding protein [Lederbergia ruris]
MKDNKYFIDTSALIALNDARDQYHTEARDIATTLNNCQFFISDAVINETYTLLRYRLGFQKAAYFLQTVLSGDSFVIADVTNATRLHTQGILEQFSDQKISYCDALSVAIMKEMQISKIFAFDHHFELMGTQLVRP